MAKAYLLSSNKKIQDYLIIIFLAIIGYWQISLVVHPLKWDIIDAYLPWRFLVSDFIQNGSIPLWNPYQHLGSPLYGNPQSGVWYPLVWILSFIRTYDIYSIHFEWMFHLIIAGLAIYKLSLQLGIQRFGRLLAAVSYMFCGIMVGNAQHLSFIISAAWIPLVIFYFLRLAENKNIKDALWLGFFAFLLISGGYPAFSFILVYLLAALALVYVVKGYKSKNYIPRYFGMLGIALLTFIVLSSGMLYSLHEVMPFLYRADGTNIEQSLTGPFSLKSFISFVTPFAVAIPPEQMWEVFGTDLSMANGYFGFLLLLILPFAFKKRIPWLFYLFLGFGVLSLWAAIGADSFFRTFLFEHIPLMNMFRFPSVFRYFFMFAMILFIARLWSEWYKTRTDNKFLKFSGIFAFLGLIIAFMLATIKSDDGLVSVLKLGLLDFYNSGVSVHMRFQLIMLLILLLTFLLIIYFVKKRELQKRLLFVLFTFEILIATQLNMPVSGYSNGNSGGEVNEYINTRPQGFPDPAFEIMDLSSDLNLEKQSPFWKNLAIWNKVPSHDGFSTYMLQSFAFIDDIQRETISQHPWLYINSEDSIIEPDYLDYHPAEITIKHHSEISQSLILQQNYYPNWECSINGSPVEMIVADDRLSYKVPLPIGENTAVIKFKASTVRTLWISNVLLVLLVFPLLMLLIKLNRKTIS